MCFGYILSIVQIATRLRDYIIWIRIRFIEADPIGICLEWRKINRLLKRYKMHSVRQEKLPSLKVTSSVNPGGLKNQHEKDLKK